MGYPYQIVISIVEESMSFFVVFVETLHRLDHRRRLLILAGGAEARNEKQLHTNFSKLSVIKAQFGSLINDVLYPIH